MNGDEPAFGVNPVLGFKPEFRQLVGELVRLVEDAPDAETYLADLESVADDLDVSVYWVVQALDWLERYGPFSEPGSSSSEEGGGR